MELSDFRQLASIFFAFFGGVGLMYIIATIVLGRGGKTRTAKERVKHARKTHERFKKEANEQLTGQANKQIHFEALDAHLEGSLWPKWFDELHALAHAVQRARIHRDLEAFQGQIMPAALDALVAGPPPDKLNQIWISAIRLQKASALPSGASATLRFHLWVEEVHGEETRLIETLEDWFLGWPPGDKNHRVMNVDRIWRRRVEPPLLNLNPPRPPTKLTADPELSLESPALEGWDLEAEMTEIAKAWLSGEDLNLHPHAQHQRDAQNLRHSFFQASWTRDDVTVESVKPARLWRTQTGWKVSAQVTATHQVRLSSPDGTQSTTRPRLWVGYLTVWRPDEGPIQLAAADLEDLWAV